MKFDMGAATLSTLARQTSDSTDDLGDLVRRLAAAASPLEGKFNGAGRVAFDEFKANADRVAADLNVSLAAILRGQHGVDVSFQSGDQDMSANAGSAAGAAPFAAARFHQA